MTQAKQTKIPPAGIVPVFGDFLRARCLFEIHVGGGWTVKTWADTAAEGAEIARANGYTPSGRAILLAVD